MHTEYKVIPAPTKGLKAKGIKTGADRFAHALQVAINLMAKDGWTYLRAETLPSEEREGLMGKTTVFQNVLVFHRPLVEVEAPIDDIAAPIEDVAEDTAENVAEPIEATEEVIEEQIDDAPDVVETK